jgi:hypothetical protein
MSDSIFLIRTHRRSNETVLYILRHPVIVVFHGSAKKPGFVVAVISVLEVDDFQRYLGRAAR